MEITKSQCMIGLTSTEKKLGILKGDFQWESIPFDVMKTYAAMDALCTFS